MDLALQSLQKACEIVPELPEVHNYYGEVLMTVGRSDEAIKKFSDASAADPNCALPLLNRGVMYMSSSDGSPSSQADLAEVSLFLFLLARCFGLKINVAFLSFLRVFFRGRLERCSTRQCP